MRRECEAKVPCSTEFMVRPAPKSDLQRHLRYVVLLAVFCVGGAACGVHTVQVSPSDSLKPGDFGLGYLEPTFRRAGGYSEQLTLHGNLEHGGSVYLRLFITNLAGANGRAELTARISMPDGSIERFSSKYKRGQWRHRGDGFDVQLGPNRITVMDDVTTLVLVNETTSAHLEAQSELPAFRPAGETVDFGEGRSYQTTVLVPRGSLTGSIQTRSKSELEEDDEPNEWALEGTVFVEHRVGNIALYDMSQRWLQVRDINSEHTYILSAFQRTSRLGGGIQAWMFVADDDGMRVYEPTLALQLRDFSTEAAGPYKVPKSIIFKGASGTVGALKTLRSVSQKSDLAFLSPLVRKLVSLVMNPWTYRHEAQYLVRSNESPDLTFEGKADYSYMQLH